MVYAPNLQEGDDLPVPWEHSEYREDSYHGRDVAPPGEFLQALELEGYAVWPALLSPEELAGLRKESGMLTTEGREYSSRQRNAGLANVPTIEPVLRQPEGRALADLIAQPTAVQRLTEIFGGPPMFLSYVYDASLMGTPGISLHTDFQP